MRPVSSATRAGTHTGLGLYARTKLTDSAASARRRGSATWLGLGLGLG